MKMKAYLKALARVVILSPLLLTGILTLATGILVKSIGYCLVGDFQSATSEIKRL